MTRIAFVIYRSWAFQIYESLSKSSNICHVPLLCTTRDAEFDVNSVPKETQVHYVDGELREQLNDLLKTNDIDIVFFFGWSNIVPRSVYENNICICLHPSALPEFRGGSPLQHQIISGLNESMVTIFKIGEGLDAGDIYRQYPLSLRGHLYEIFARLSDIGILAAQQIISDYNVGKLAFKAQSNLDAYPPYKRRKPEESEIKLADLSTMTTVKFLNFVRALADPYPNAYIKVGTKKILIKSAELVSTPEIGAEIINEINSSPGEEEALYARLKDGYVHLKDYSVV